MDSQDSISPVSKRFKLSSGDEDDYDQLHGKTSFDCKAAIYILADFSTVLVFEM
jgi:hypothetical protein